MTATRVSHSTDCKPADLEVYITLHSQQSLYTAPSAGDNSKGILNKCTYSIMFVSHDNNISLGKNIWTDLLLHMCSDPSLCHICSHILMPLRTLALINSHVLNSLMTSVFDRIVFYSHEGPSI